MTDTFESTERQDTLDDDMFGTNNERLKKQQEVPITAIITNPPYSIGQKSVNNDNANVKYPNLISRINDTYAKYSNASLKKSLKDTYIEAIRWASDRIEDRGVIGFISNAGFIDSKSTDGLRHCLYKEFNYIYIFNLHGDQLHTNGEESKKEGGKIFGSGSRTPTAITILVKDGSDNHKLYYKDIKSYLSRSEKLETIRETTSIQNIQWKEIIPDKQNNWINQIDNDYMNFSALFAKNTTAIMKKQFTGVNVSRDNWLVGFNKKKVETNAKTLILNYNSEIKRLKNVADPKKRLELRNTSEKFIKWSAKLNNMFKKGQSLGLTGKVVPIMQRPFTKKWLYWDNDLNERPSKYRDIYKYMGKILYMQGAGSKKDFSALITDQLPSLRHCQIVCVNRSFS
ncbi:type ISP restriction/modification enzyme [Lactobacillus helveticus]|uniref:Type ISP restriction-modification enzyme LLaBIII C-terminal specificity domain-containing protein n=1 Tax=Lactobacillus helveticus TaxID=1587 RepID=A0A8H9F6S9_LACHE|nr:type ISP restriction/modification enzyme [Lactobacillus helveticus]GFO98592.1 hypothetical protein LHEH8_03480 [Lactobacillus helveticus]GFP01134.1 hypothetical protein LHEW6_09670 [Lactobacillus helveticus]GFP03527.1 hypothetical protein LHEY10_14560 [Lactobacillus helveticus]